MYVDERVAIALSLLTTGNTLAQTAFVYQRGQTSCWETLYKFCKVVVDKLQHELIVFPTGDAAIASVR